MAISANPFALKNLTLDAQELRQALASLVPNGGGVIQSGDLQVIQSTTASLTVQVTPGRVWLPGTNTANLSGQAYSPQGMYFAFNDANYPVTLPTADPTNPRIDVIYAYVQDSAFGAAADKIAFTYVKGTAAATPQIPALPTGINAVSLAQVSVAANATAITNGNITQTPLPVVGPPKADVYATAAGQATLTIGTNSASGSVAITFPSGRFSQPPIVNATKAGGGLAKYSVWISNITTTGATLNVYSGDGTATTGSLAIDWTAVQMTSTSAAG